MARKAETLEELIARHFPCVGCTKIYGKEHHQACPVNYRYRAERLVKDLPKITSPFDFRLGVKITSEWCSLCGEQTVPGQGIAKHRCRRKKNGIPNRHRVHTARAATSRGAVDS